MTELADLTTKPQTFMGAPHGHDLSRAKAAILGVPFDCGIHPFRIGSRQGPQAIREQSVLVRPYNPELADFNPVERLGLVDCGNVKLVPSKIEAAFAAIEQAMDRIVASGAIPVTMGGDGSVSLPQMRALAKRHPGLVALHIDSHTDNYSYKPEQKYSAATQFTHAAEEKLIDSANSFHIGIRGSTHSSGIMAQTKALGYRVISMRQFWQHGMADVLKEVHAVMKGRPVYLCWDMDVFDPSVAPGVCSPTWGGFSAREGIELLRGFEGLDIVAVDVNTVSPPHDVQNMAAHLAGYTMYESLVLLCRKLGLDQPVGN
ncbi:MAG: agmatinase [Alphaproteobacteria bacterium]|nr:agmatinase [Alphaproteobacteria bacterium]